MKVFKYNRWLLLFIAIGLAAALAISFQRHAAEQVNRQVDMAIDYEGLIELAEREGKPVDEVLQQAKEAGITSLAVYDTTFKKLNANGKATAIAGSQLLADYHSGRLADPLWQKLAAEGKIIGTAVYIVGHHAQTWKELKEDLPRRLGKDRVSLLREVNRLAGRIGRTDLIYREEDVQELKDLVTAPEPDCGRIIWVVEQLVEC